jgi:dCMP deaminase
MSIDDLKNLDGYKLKYVRAYMDMAKRFGETSNAERRRVGALIIKNGHIIAQGVNGQPPGWPTEVCEGEDGLTLPTVRHAEVAALEKLQRSTESSDAADMFVSLSPCMDCAIKIKSAGIKSVYYGEDYRCLEGIKYLRDNGITVIKV